MRDLLVSFFVIVGNIIVAHGRLISSPSHHGNHHGTHGSHGNNFRDAIAVGPKALVVQEDLFANGTALADGKICIDKVMMQERTEYEEVMTCTHDYVERCSWTRRV